MLKLIKISLLLSFTLVIIYFIYVYFVDSSSFEPYIYWLLLIDLLMFISLYRKSSRFSLYFSFILFIISSAVVSLGFKSVAEFVMRLSFILLLTGYVQSLIESKGSK